jgi:1-phosphofructokinase
MIVTLTPNPGLDRTYAVDGLLPGEVHRASQDWIEAGGKGVNVTRVLHAHEVPTRAVLPSGGPTGASLLDLLREDRIVVDAVPIMSDLRCNITITEPGGAVTKVNAIGPALSSVEVEALIARAVDVVAASAASMHATDAVEVWLVGCGSLGPGAPDDLFAQVIERARRAVPGGLRIAMDSSGAALAASVAVAPDVIKPNLTELEELCARPLPTLGEVRDGARRLVDDGVGTVLVSLGSDGALLVRADAVLHAESPVREVRTTVGAGDALLAGFLSHVGAGPADALRHAVAFGAAAVQRSIGAVAGPAAIDVPSVILTEGFDPSRPSRSRASAPAERDMTVTAGSRGDRGPLGERE